MTLVAPAKSAGFSTRLAGVADRLSDLSHRATLVPRRLDWPDALPDDAWVFAPELCSLFGTPAWEALSEAQQRRLAFFECVNFFSLNIHGEKSLLEGLARRLYSRSMGELTGYLHHFLDEENQHMQMFGGFAWRYAGKVYPDKKLAGSRDFRPGEEDLLFFVRVVIFEEIVDVYNHRMSDDARLHPLAREINLIHHLDETRHLAFGRLLVEELWARVADKWTEAQKDETRAYAAAYLEQTWKEYWNPDVYRDAGLPEPHALARAAFLHPVAVAHRADVAGKVVRRLQAIGLLPAATPAPVAGLANVLDSDADSLVTAPLLEALS